MIRTIGQDIEIKRIITECYVRHLRYIDVGLGRQIIRSDVEEQVLFNNDLYNCLWPIIHSAARHSVASGSDWASYWLAWLEADFEHSWIRHIPKYTPIKITKEASHIRASHIK